MTVDVLLDVFLALGGTTKKSAGSTGGFGKAKELLILPWLAWEIHTKDVLVQGRGGEYSEPIRAPFMLHGTRLTVWMDKTGDYSSTTPQHAIDFLVRCYLPKVRFTVNGDVVVAGLRPGKELREFTAESANVKLTIHYDKSGGHTTRALIRSNGLFMFEEYFGEDVPGRIIGELHGRSYDVLLDSREGFADRQLRDQISAFAQEVAGEAMAALQVKKKLIKKIYRGQGLVEESNSLAAELVANAPILRPRKKPSKESGVVEQELEEQAFSDEFIAEATTYVRDREANLGDRGRDGTPVMVTPSTAIAAMLGQGARSTEEMQEALKTLAWMPDVYVVNEIEDFKIPTAWLPGKSFGKIPHKTLRLWSELCRFALIGFREHKPFGVGWIFSENTEGEWRREPDPETGERRDWLLFNPLRITGDRWERKITSRPRVRLSDEADLLHMFSVAIHEAVHLITPGEGHNDIFARELTMAFAKFIPRWPLVRKIKAAVAKTSRDEEGPSSAVAAPRRLPKQDKVFEVFSAVLRTYQNAGYAERALDTYGLDFWSGVGAALNAAAGTFYQGWNDNVSDFTLDVAAQQLRRAAYSLVWDGDRSGGELERIEAGVPEAAEASYGWRRFLIDFLYDYQRLFQPGAVIL